jgi:hypothetical protein
MCKSGFFHFIIKIFNDFLSSLRGFFPFLGDLGPFLRPYLGGKLGDGYQLQAYKNQRLLEAIGRFRAGLCCKNIEPNPLSCREAIEEGTFAGHFWELRSSNLGVVSFDGFLRSGRT